MANDLIHPSIHLVQCLPMVSTVYRHSHTAVLQGCRHWSCITDQGSVGCPSYLQARPGWLVLVAGEERVLHHGAGFKVSAVSAAPPRFWRQNLPSILYLASTSTQYAAPTLPHTSVRWVINCTVSGNWLSDTHQYTKHQRIYLMCI